MAKKLKGLRLDMVHTRSDGILPYDRQRRKRPDSRIGQFGRFTLEAEK